VFFLNSSLTEEDISDGLGYTVFVGEKISPSRFRQADEDLDLGWVSGTRATLRNVGWAVNHEIREKAKRQDLQEPIRKVSPLEVGGFSSWHSQGAQFLFGDGRVQFLGIFTTPEVLQRLGNRADGQLVSGY
ncbi:MAG: DUF1559 domain-containing protein, partial [Planctomycetes bacterium]|nr:DUF1559 domain-containing protein [Planctomycetota bacterium]